MEVSSHALLNSWNQQVVEPKLPFLCLVHKHMMKHHKKKPGSLTGLVSANVTHVQDNAFESQARDQEMNKLFSLALSE